MVAPLYIQSSSHPSPISQVFKRKICITCRNTENLQAQIFGWERYELQNGNRNKRQPYRSFGLEESYSHSKVQERMECPNPDSPLISKSPSDSNYNHKLNTLGNITTSWSSTKCQYPYIIESFEPSISMPIQAHEASMWRPKTKVYLIESASPPDTTRGRHSNCFQPSVLGRTIACDPAWLVE